MLMIFQWQEFWQLLTPTRPVFASFKSEVDAIDIMVLVENIWVKSLLAFPHRRHLSPPIPRPCTRWC